MRMETDKCHLHVIIVNGLIKIWVVYYGALKHYFSQPQMHHKNQETHG